MIKGITVTLQRPVSNGVDEFNNPVVTWINELVDDVLIVPGAAEEIPGHTRPNGDKTVLRLHFPKTFTGSLRGCRLVVFDRVWLVEGNPAPFMAWNTPTRWHMPVTAVQMEG